MSFSHILNNEITAAEVRVVDQDGKQLGIMSTRNALNIARNDSLDLVEMVPNATPPVCRILDYGKFKYEQQKKKRENERKNRAARVETKELWVRPNTDDQDVDIKVKRAKAFLKKGDKVKFTMKFRGREITHKDKGEELLKALLVKLGDSVTVVQPIKQHDRNMVLIVAPAK